MKALERALIQCVTALARKPRRIERELIMRARTPMRLAAVFGLLLFGAMPSMAQTASRPESDTASQSVPVVTGEVGSRVVRLGVGRSIVVDFPREIKDVLVAEPKIANAVVA